MKMTAKGLRRRTIKGGQKAQLKRAKKIQMKNQRIEKFFGNKEVEREVNISLKMKKDRDRLVSVYNNVKELKYLNRRVVRKYTYVPVTEVDDCEAVISSYATIDNSFLVEMLEKKYGKEDSITGYLDEVITSNKEREEGYVSSFSPLKNVILVDLSVLYNADPEIAQEEWKSIMKKGIMMKEGNLIPVSRVSLKSPYTELYVPANISSSGQKGGKILMVNVGIKNFKDATNFFESEKDVLNYGLSSIIQNSSVYSIEKADKYMKRSCSTDGASGFKLGDIDLTKWSVMIKKTPFKDGKDLIHMNGLQISNEVLDGLAYANVELIQELMIQKFGILFSYHQILNNNFQMRISGLAGKSFMKTRTAEYLSIMIDNIKDKDDYIILGRGPVALITDSNVMKLLKDYMSQDVVKLSKLGLHVMDVAHAPSGTINMGSQLSNKFGRGERELYDRLIEKKAKENAVKIIESTKSMEKRPVTANMTLSELVAASLGGEKAFKTTLVQRDVLKRLQDSCKPIAKKGAVAIEGYTLAVSMEEGPVISPKAFTNVLGETEDGRVEIYSQHLPANKDCVLIKYPSSGRYEYIKARTVSIEKICSRLESYYAKSDIKDAAKIAGEVAFNYVFDGEGTLLMANHNIDAIWLAGFDKDFDKMTVILEEDFVKAIDEINVNKATFINL